MSSSTGYWTFFCNPRIWDPRNAIQRTYEEFNVDPKHKDLVLPGHRGLIRVSYDKRIPAELRGRSRLARGIYAVVEITERPQLKVSSLTREYDDLKRRGRNHYYATLTYLDQMYENPIPVEAIPESAYDGFLIEGFRAATMPLSPKAFAWVFEEAKRRRT